MMIQMNCRGFAVAQFMQPEPAKYTHAPNLEAKTFMQPEQPYYAHHPGRFFYIKNEASGEIFSAPYEPVRAPLQHYRFSVGKYDVQWHIEHAGLQLELTLQLPVDDVVELWQLKVRNISGQPKRLSIYPYFPFGYMSWMNQCGQYRKDLGGVVASCVTPYQKVADYFKNKHFKDKSYLLHETEPDSFDVNQAVFEGETGLHQPAGVTAEQLSGSDAIYETPAAALQYRLQLEANGEQSYRFVLGPAFDDAEIAAVREKYFPREGTDTFAKAAADYKAYIDQGKGVVQVQTPDTHFNDFVNHWLGRQVFYHGDVNRLTTDPQTRNYLQDNMGMAYIKPEVTRNAFLHALSQQETSGAMPDGIILVEGTELKYINQIPHTDHCVWLPVCLQAYLDETDDYALLDEEVEDADGLILTVKTRITNAMRWLIKSRDERGLSYIAQGDWCDPMNMVGYKGKGVSGWLSVATAYALNLWAGILEEQDSITAKELREHAQSINESVNQHLWDGHWYGRGITDEGVVFGTAKDPEGRIFLNPQSWAMLAGACSAEQKTKMIEAVEQQLETPYGPAMLAPAFTAMRDDVGRVTQKFPGSAENGSVYNHAAVFYIFSLFSEGEGERAYKLLRQMITGPDDEDYLQRGQLPVFIPNYYRGAYYQHRRTAGRSSQLFNTGTVSWVYRCLIEGLFGLKGDRRGLLIQPQLPAHWPRAEVTRHFRGAEINIQFERADVQSLEVYRDKHLLADNRLDNIQSGEKYQLRVLLPMAE